MSFVLSYYGRPLASGDMDALERRAELLQKKAISPVTLEWSVTKSGRKLLIVNPDYNNHEHRVFGGYELVRVEVLAEGES